MTASPYRNVGSDHRVWFLCGMRVGNSAFCGISMLWAATIAASSLEFSRRGLSPRSPLTLCSQVVKELFGRVKRSFGFPSNLIIAQLLDGNGITLEQRRASLKRKSAV